MALVSSSSSHFGYGDRRSTSSSINKKVMTLPRIEHPSTLINAEDRSSLDVRGRSRDGSGVGELVRSETSTPEIRTHRRRSSSLKRVSQSSIYPEPLTRIPENISVTYGEDRDKVRLPIFGHRPDSTASSYRAESGNTTPMTSRVPTGELETILREKVRAQLHDVRAKFRHAADYDANGRISRQALHHIIASIFGTHRQVGPNQIDKLLEQLHLKQLNRISFDEFLKALFNGNEDLPGWVSRQSAAADEYLPKRTAAQMFIILKDKARTKHRDLVALCPSLDGGQPSRIFKTQFQNALIDMGYRMKDREFDKLWDKFDTDGFHAVNSDKFLKRLTSEDPVPESLPFPTSETQDQQLAILKAPQLKSSNSDSQSQTPRLPTSHGQIDEDQIQTWLNHKFPQGFSQLERALDRLDIKQTGNLPRDRFVEELKRFGLSLEGHILDYFLKRLDVDVTLTHGAIPYRDVINAFKQRTDPTKRRTNADNPTAPEETRQTSLERQVEYLISSNYERVEDELIRLDNNRNGTVTSNDMRSLIEDLLEFPLRPDEYYQLMKQLPVDEHGKIKYKDYLKQVLDRSQSAPTQQQQQQKKPPLIPQWEYMRSKNIRDSLNQEHMNNKKREKTTDITDTDEEKTRSLEELREILKTIIRTRYKDIEDEFKKVDRGSYGELTQDLLYDLFKHLHIKPEITRSEITLLWSRCHLKENGNLDFYQFLREFGYSKRSAHYPNAKQNPPKKGDADFLLTSRKLYGDSVLVHGAALNAIRSHWDQLRREFTQLDPYRTGYVQSDEFDDILTELCSAVNQEDLDMLKSRFETKHDSRMNYVRFLKHHVPLAELIEEIDEPRRKSIATVNENTLHGSFDRSHGIDLATKLRRKLSDSLKQLRRAFKQQDLTNSGSIPIRSFKQILNQFKCSLSDEDFYTLASELDTKMDGTINYNYFIQQYIKST